MLPEFSKRNVKVALRHPRLIWLMINGHNLIELNKEHIEIHLKKISQISLTKKESDLIKLVSRAIDICPSSCYHTEYLNLVCRLTRPEKIVETGVHYGASSAFILQALKETGGFLFSIDLPNVTYQRDNGTYHYDPLRTGLEPGFIVPERLKGNWKLILGNSRKKLPELLKAVGEIDIFHHDSMHTYDLMTFEYETAWPYLKDNGLLISHDANWNDAFKDFCHRHSIEHNNYCIYKGIGIARKLI